MLSAAACAKCVLFGEHSILNGGSALTLPIKKLRLKINFQPGAANELRYSGSPLPADAAQILWKLLATEFADVNSRGQYEIASDIPVGAGLGSSAALCVALERLHRPELAVAELTQRAWHCENLFHGTSSGMDPTTIAHERALYFRSPTDFEPLRDGFLSDPDFIFVLVDSAVRRSAQAGIAHTQKLKTADPELWEKKLGALHALAAEGRALFENSEAHSLGVTMNLAHELLRSWDLSHPALEAEREILLAAGAIGVKLTGAGRGGFLLALFAIDDWRALQTRAAAQRNFIELRS